MKKKVFLSTNLKSNASKLHSLVFSFCKKKFPYYTILQEYPIDIEKNGQKSVLFVDIFIKELDIAIECNGIQHYKPNKFFFNGSHDFKMAQSRDEDKKEWMGNNNIVFIVFKYNDKMSYDFFEEVVNNAVREEYERRSKS